MSVRSMTGFARVRKEIAEGEIVLTLKTVNHRGLDMHFHLPLELDAVENDIRAVVRNGVARGHVQIHIGFTRASAALATPLNRAMLHAYIRAFQEAIELYQIPGMPDINAALRLPGMLSTGGENAELSEEVVRAIVDAAREAVAMLNQVREREGAATAIELRERCRAIHDLVTRMDEIRAGAAGAFQKRLKEKLADLLHGAGIDPQRLAQEAALLADRSDIAEELMRLRTHAGQLEAMLSAGGEAGKRLDFLLQEMNRESNTVLSKTGGLGDLGLTITDLALAAKSEIDKIREQALNLE
jgi:uncharacterized protein (TIGR00255 family)